MAQIVYAFSSLPRSFHQSIAATLFPPLLSLSALSLMSLPSSSIKVCILAAGSAGQTQKTDGGQAQDATTDVRSSSRFPPSPVACFVFVSSRGSSYGTRLERDIRDDAAGTFKHLIGVPKPLVPINSLPLLTRWVRLLLNSNSGLTPADIFIVGNAYNHIMLLTWLRTLEPAERIPETNVLNDGSMDNASRLGAVKDLDLLMQTKLGADAASADGSSAPSSSLSGLLVIGGDTLFYPDFPLSRILSDFRADPSISRVLWYAVKTPEKYGILELDDSGLVVSFKEKPRAADTESRKACPCFYLLSAAALQKLHPFVSSASSLAEVDAPGNFLRHLVGLNTAAAEAAKSLGEDSKALLIPIAAHEISGRFDIGGLDTYVQCDEWFRKVENEGGDAAQKPTQL